MKDNITMVCVETRPEKQKGMLDTLRACLDMFPVKEALFFSSSTINLSQEDKEVRKISNVSSMRHMNHKDDYDYFVLLNVVDYIRTSHILFIQADGFILNPDKWEDSWTEYHYIGSPWQLDPMHRWPPHPPVTIHNRVGNGGFSLRSTVLMKAAKSLFCDLSRDPNFSEKYWCPEDCFICRTGREYLVAKGFKFAPYDVARKFAIENDRIVTPTFGFHGPETMRINNIDYI